MEATELRAGNYANFELHKSCGGTKQVEVCGRDIILLETKSLETGKRFSPILLTKEWLIKFGFYQDEKNVYMCLNIVLLRLRISHGTVTLIQSGESIRVPEIIYVHQLQNLYFALTGKELKQI